MGACWDWGLGQSNELGEKGMICGIQEIGAVWQGRVAWVFCRARHETGGMHLSEKREKRGLLLVYLGWPVGY